MKVIAINGSPRKENNTATLLGHALDGARQAGAETELISLYDYAYTGCVSCFSCKRINGKSYGRCAVRDALTPVLDKAMGADVLFFGSPIYFGMETAAMRAFMERFLFPFYTYADAPLTLAPQRIRTAFFYTMSVPETLHPQLGYDKHFDLNRSVLTRLFGSSEIVLSTQTLQFPDPEPFFCPAVDMDARLKRHAEVFPEECRRAFALGERLAQ